jgi:hypothetical protein
MVTLTVSLTNNSCTYTVHLTELDKFGFCNVVKHRNEACTSNLTGNFLQNDRDGVDEKGLNFFQFQKG